MLGLVLKRNTLCNFSVVLHIHVTLSLYDSWYLVNKPGTAV